MNSAIYSLYTLAQIRGKNRFWGDCHHFRGNCLFSSKKGGKSDYQLTTASGILTFWNYIMRIEDDLSDEFAITHREAGCAAIPLGGVDHAVYPCVTALLLGFGSSLSKTISSRQLFSICIRNLPSMYLAVTMISFSSFFGSPDNPQWHFSVRCQRYRSNQRYQYLLVQGQPYENKS
jgi:hypothetical protein